MGERTEQQAKPKRKGSWMEHLIRQGWRYSYKYIKATWAYSGVNGRDFKLYNLVLAILRNRGV